VLDARRALVDLFCEPLDKIGRSGGRVQTWQKSQTVTVVLERGPLPDHQTNQEKQCYCKETIAFEQIP
jgi:hypothetical protein